MWRKPSSLSEFYPTGKIFLSSWASINDQILWTRPYIAMNCRDLAAQEAFYSKHFGFQCSRTFKAGNPDE
jgi:hypothetical protein